MRKWNRDRRRPPKAPGEGGPGAQDMPAEAREEQPAPENIDGDSAPETNAGAPGAARGRSRRGRRKKKPAAAAPGSESMQQPLRPAYTATEGPRPAVSVVLEAGAPTGEAGELEEPAEPALMPAPAPVPEATAARRVPKGAVVLSVGLPGSGKTTWFKRKGVTPLSSDLLRTLLFDDATEQRHQDLVFSSLRSLLRARMIARMPSNYVDATNLSPKERRHWIRMAREFGYEVHAVFFDVPLEVCMERNRKRQRVVPDEVMQRMATKLRPPTFEEGFSKIVVVRVKHRVTGEATETPRAQGGELEQPEAEVQTLPEQIEPAEPLERSEPFEGEE